jgi:hypothetical protein
MTMNEQTNTAGPWRLLHNQRGKGGRIVGARNKTVCFLPAIGRNGSADALLIIEAPALQARNEALAERLEGLESDVACQQAIARLQAGQGQPFDQAAEWAHEAADGLR